MKRFFSQVLLTLALLCGVIFVGCMFVACFSNNTDIVHTGLVMSQVSVGFAFIFALIGVELSKGGW